MEVPEGFSKESAESKGSHQIPPLKDRWEGGEKFIDFHRKTIIAYNQ